MKVAVIADSTGYLPQEIIDKYNIPIAPLSVTFDDGHTFTENDQFSIDDFIRRWLHLKLYLQQVSPLLVNG